jgi:hypothetical protein
MFFIISLLVRIKSDESVREKSYDIVKEINEFLEIWGQCGNEKKVEEALAKRQRLRDFVDAYLYALEQKEIDKLLREAEKTQEQQKQKTSIQKNPPRVTPPEL